MPEFQPCLYLVQAASHPRKILLPDLLAAPVSLALLELLKPWPLLPHLPLLAEEAGPRTAGLAPPLDDRRRCRALFAYGTRRCEPGMMPPPASARPARWYGQQCSPPCCGRIKPRIL